MLTARSYFPPTYPLSPKSTTETPTTSTPSIERVDSHFTENASYKMAISHQRFTMSTEGFHIPVRNFTFFDIESEEDTYYHGQFRTCHYCGTLTERQGGRNSVACLNPQWRKDCL